MEKSGRGKSSREEVLKLLPIIDRVFLSSGGGAGFPSRLEPTATDLDCTWVPTHLSMTCAPRVEFLDSLRVPNSNGTGNRTAPLAATAVLVAVSPVLRAADPLPQRSAPRGRTCQDALPCQRRLN